MTPAATTKKRRRNTTTTDADYNASSSPKFTKTRRSKLKVCPVCLTATRPSQLVNLTTTCNCEYCKPCLRESLNIALQSGTSLTATPDFPAKCCGRPIDDSSESVSKAIPATLRRAYRRKRAEMAASQPLYCAHKECGAFIQDVKPPSAQDDMAKDEEIGFAACAFCHMKTCLNLTCKRLQKEHVGIHAICPDAIADTEVERLANEKKWKRCPKCWALVEKSKGCDAMRCTCRAEWCYTCGKMFKARENDRCRCQGKPVVMLNEDDNDDFQFPPLGSILGLGMVQVAETTLPRRPCDPHSRT